MKRKPSYTLTIQWKRSVAPRTALNNLIDRYNRGELDGLKVRSVSLSFAGRTKP